MTQGNINESKLRLNAVEPHSASRRNKVIKAQDILKLPSGTNDKSQTATGQQPALSKTKKPFESFDNIRDSHKSMVLLLDTMFDLLQVHIYETRADSSGTKPPFNIQRPSFEKQTNKSWLNTAPEQPAFSGKIYTHDWSLILKGTTEVVFCYVIPSDRVISFNSDPEIYRPYLTINSFKKGSSFGWQIDGQTISQAHLEQLTSKLFDKLLKSMRSQQWNESTFCLPSIGVGPPSLEVTGSNKEWDMPSRQDPEQILLELMQAAQEAAPKADEFKFSEKDKTATAASQAANNKKADTSPTGQSLEQTLKLLVDLLNQKLEQLVGEGAQALTNHDFRAAQRVLTLTNELDDFKKKANTIMVALDDKAK